MSPGELDPAAAEYGTGYLSKKPLLWGLRPRTRMLICDGLI